MTKPTSTATLEELTARIATLESDNKKLREAPAPAVKNR